MRRALRVLPPLATCLALLTPAAPASAHPLAGPRWGQAEQVPGLVALNQGGGSQPDAVSCASPGNCSVGGYYTANRTTNPPPLEAYVASKTGGTWGNAEEVPGFSALNVDGYGMPFGLSCASAGNCSANGFYTDESNREQGFVVTEKNSTWGKAEEVPGTGALNVDGGAYVNSLSCASAGNCAAIGNYADSSHLSQMFVVNETNGTRGNAEEIPGTAALNTGDAGAFQVSCGPVGNCAATGYYVATGDVDEAFVVSETGGTWGDAEQVPGVTTLGAMGSGGQSLSCTSVNHCTAAGWYSQTGSGSSYIVTEK